ATEAVACSQAWSGQLSWRNGSPFSPFSAWEMSQVTVVHAQLGQSASAVHFTRCPGFNSSTRMRWVGPPKPKLAIEPTFASAWLAEVQNDARPLAVETAS